MVEGTVVKGDQRGRELGFPTANLVPDDRLAIPGHGVYAAFANGVPAAVNVGVRPTFESGRGVLIETYLIDRDEDLYGKTLRVAFVERLRGEKRLPRGRRADRPDAPRRRGRKARLRRFTPPDFHGRGRFPRVGGRATAHCRPVAALC